MSEINWKSPTISLDTIAACKISLTFSRACKNVMSCFISHLLCIAHFHHTHSKLSVISWLTFSLNFCTEQILNVDFKFTHIHFMWDIIKRLTASMSQNICSLVQNLEHRFDMLNVTSQSRLSRKKLPQVWFLQSMWQQHNYTPHSLHCITAFVTHSTVLIIECNIWIWLGIAILVSRLPGYRTFLQYCNTGILKAPIPVIAVLWILLAATWVWIAAPQQ